MREENFWCKKPRYSEVRVIARRVIARYDCTFRSELVKCKDENVPDSDQEGRKRPRFRSARYENVPNSDQQGTKTSQIPISKDENVPDSDTICLVLMRSSAIFGKICEKVRLEQKYAELCGEWRIMRNCAEDRKMCDIALTALKCCLWAYRGSIRAI